MQRHSVKISTFIIIISIAAVYLQFFCYYFFDKPWIAIGIAIISSLLIAHFSLELSLSYESGFLQTLFTVIICFLLILYVYFNQETGFIPYRRHLPLLLLSNWLVPFCYYFLRHLNDKGPRFVGYRSFFLKTSVLFGLFYILILADKLFLRPLSFPEASLELSDANFIPFWTTASYIEAYIYKKAELAPLLIYAAKNIILYLPFGFYLGLAAKNLGLMAKAILLLIFPALAEGVQLYLHLGRCDMDDYFYGLMGSVLGMVLYYIINRMFIAKTNYYFLKEFRTSTLLRKRF